MKLLGTQTSPYARKARLLMLEKHIPHDYVIDPPQDPDSLVQRVNPLGRIPALILDDGFCVFDSAVITDYADTLNDTPILIPRADKLARLRVKRWEALCDGIMDSAVVVRMESLRPAGQQNHTTLELHNTAVTHALEYASHLLGDANWCEGQSLTLADLALVSALIYLDLRQADRDWRSAHVNLATWFARMGERPSVITSMSA